MKTTLIQRAKFENRDYKKGIDSIVHFDYMGSSEFEWGALPESLGKIRDLINDYTYLDVLIKDKVITVFCKDSQKSEVKQYLTELSENKWYLQEYSNFDNYINPSQNFKSETDFWWDISNHLMFWRKNIKFESNFKTIIVTKPS
jgi:hypothetical protein